MEIRRMGMGFRGAVALLAVVVASPGMTRAQERGPSHGHAESHADARERIVAEAQVRDSVLAEMRAMLVALRSILVSLGEDDLEGAEKAARDAGTAHAVDTDPKVRAQIPQRFLDLGMQTHEGFDRLANRIAEGATAPEIVRDLGELTNRCVVCHQAFRLDERPAPKHP